jgi:hypothetical protein
MSEISPQKIRILEKETKRERERRKKRKREKGREKKEQGLKNKIGETSYEEAPCFKRRRKKEDEIYKLLGEILSKERKEITFSYSAKSDV